ncbi:Hypothetical predicted protein [Mytilus galloprovincialis]|uniref:Uncharacterized protein n=1 Tax=Mytilus galloprovincialis TaxID=29158 RepID=A0A8B6CPK1_MYTGA|nr:Hypothetical predicted protein [Mytilus galloprovincialis]
MAEKLPPDDLPYYKSQLDEIFEQCRTKLDTLHLNTTDQHDQPYIPSDPLLFSPIGRTHKTESYESRALSQAPESSTIRGEYCLYERSEVDPLRLSSRYVDESNIEVGPSSERIPNIIDRCLRSKSSIPRVSEGTADLSSSEFRPQPRTLSFPSVDKNITATPSYRKYSTPILTQGNTGLTNRNIVLPPKVSERIAEESSKEIRSPLYLNLPKREFNNTNKPEITNLSTAPLKQVSFRKPNSIMRKEKEPDKFDGRNVDWQDYIVHFEQTAIWNQLVRLAYPDHDKTEDLAIDQFVKGLENFELQKRVQFSHPLTLESAIAIAIEYEAFVGSTSMTSEIKKPKEPQTDIGVNAVKKVENRGYGLNGPHSVKSLLNV